MTQKIIIFILIVAFFLCLTIYSLLFPQRWLITFLAPFICPNAVYFQATDKPIIALTIDDSPDTNTTSAILNVLNQYQTIATFFPLSEAAAQQPRLIQAMVDQGHEIGNHLTRDEPSIKLKEQFEPELKQAQQTLSQFTTVKWLRPGNGWCNQKMVTVAQKYGYQIALGSVWSYDTHIPSTRFASWFILNNVQPGAIIVLHDGGQRGVRTAKILNQIIPQLQQKGYRFVTLSNLIQ